jgi:hypothetical protein
MIVGDIELRGRFAALDAVRVRRRVVVEVCQLVVEQEPEARTTRPEPPVDSIVNVYDTTLPHLSDVVRCVVVSDCNAGRRCDARVVGYGFPGGTAPGAAVGVISARRVAA